MSMIFYYSVYDNATVIKISVVEYWLLQIYILVTNHVILLHDNYINTDMYCILFLPSTKFVVQHINNTYAIVKKELNRNMNNICRVHKGCRYLQNSETNIQH